MQPQVYTPGAGHRPGPSLPGRAQLRARWAERLTQADLEGRRRSADLVLTGLRGVGKTVLIGQFIDDAADARFSSVAIQATRGHGLLPELTSALETASESHPEGFWRRAAGILGRISGVSVAGVGVDWEATTPTPPVIGHSSGQLAGALAELAEAIRRHNDGRGGLVIAVDEIQAAPAVDLETLGAALHQLNTQHSGAPVVFVAAGLPNTHDTMLGSDPNRPLITHPERLFNFEELPIHLDEAAVATALLEPAREAGATWTAEAVTAMYELTKGYPAHLQVCAAATWEQAVGPTVTPADVQAALPAAAAEIERQFLAPRWNRLSDRQQEYLTALAVCGGTATARQMSMVLERRGGDLSVFRAALIERGEIYAPRSGVVTLTMPLMADYAPTVYPDARDASELHDALLPLERLTSNAQSWATATTARQAYVPGSGVSTTEALRRRVSTERPPLEH